MPARVNRYEYWDQMPPRPSPRALSWVKRIQAGWLPNRRIRALGYDESAEWFGVYLWEWFHVLLPLLSFYVEHWKSWAENRRWELEQHARRYQIDMGALSEQPVQR